MTETCETCKHWNTDKPGEDEDYRECTKKPAVTTAWCDGGSSGIHTACDQTHRSETCKLYKRRSWLTDIDTMKGGA